MVADQRMRASHGRLRVLAVTPRFAPLNAADSHRLRLLVPHAKAHGWDVEVLAVEPADVGSSEDAWLAQQLPADVPVHRVRCSRLVSAFCNTVALRALFPLYAKGAQVLNERKFDIVFFSTTEFLSHLLGLWWRRRFHVPFCMDYQDPWVNDYYHANPAVPKPGGNTKYGLMHALDKFCERRVVAACGGFLAVSARYLADLEQRYGAAVAGKPKLVRGFPGEPAELQALLPTNAEKTSSASVWRYIGRGGADMAKAASAFFLAWQRAVAEGIVTLEEIHVEAHGTSYARADRATPTLAPLAQATMIARNVRESTDRLPYSTMLSLLRQSDALIVFGSDDTAYTASKIYPYLLAGKPLLAIFHTNSSVVELMQQVGGGTCVGFTAAMTVDDLAAVIFRRWFATREFKQVRPLDRLAFEPYTAGVQAAEVGQWLRAVVTREADGTA